MTCRLLRPQPGGCASSSSQQSPGPAHEQNTHATGLASVPLFSRMYVLLCCRRRYTSSRMWSLSPRLVPHEQAIALHSRAQAPGRWDGPRRTGTAAGRATPMHERQQPSGDRTAHSRPHPRTSATDTECHSTGVRARASSSMRCKYCSRAVSCVANSRSKASSKALRSCACKSAMAC